MNNNLLVALFTYTANNIYKAFTSIISIRACNFF